MFPLNSISASCRGGNRAKTNFCPKFCVLREDGRRNSVLSYGAYGWKQKSYRTQTNKITGYQLYPLIVNC